MGSAAFGEPGGCRRGRRGRQDGGGYTIPSSAPDMFVYTVREPVGVVAAVTPWNSPLALLMAG
jgi:acyl-CoA reductase-like NAD-dependent aldehyde dehydrogenase